MKSTGSDRKDLLANPYTPIILNRCLLSTQHDKYVVHTVKKLFKFKLLANFSNSSLENPSYSGHFDSQNAELPSLRIPLNLQVLVIILMTIPTTAI